MFSTERRRRFLIATAFFAVIALSGILYYRSTNGPGTERSVMRQLAAAMTAGDTAELCRLADPDEIAKLGLTPQNVDGFLRETLWVKGPPRVDGWNKVDRPMPRDRALYLLWLTFVNGTHWKMEVSLLEKPDHTWSVVLSELLWRGSGIYKRGTHPKNYVSLAYKYGIRGFRKPTGEDEAIETLAQVWQRLGYIK